MSDFKRWRSARIRQDHEDELAKARADERARIRREQATVIAALRHREEAIKSGSTGWLVGAMPSADEWKYWADRLEEVTRDAEPYDGDRGSGSWRGEERDA